MAITPVDDKFFGYVQPAQVIAAALIAGFEDKPISGLNFTDAKGRKFVDYHECTMVGAIALAESSNNIFATHVNSNGTIDQGVLQINSIHNENASPLVSPFTLVGAAQLAYQIYNDAGQSFSPWNATHVNPDTGMAEVADWYYEAIGLTRLQYASDGVAIVRKALKDGRSAGQSDEKTLNRLTRFDLRDFAPYQ